MRLFNRQVFNTTAYFTEQYTDVSFNDMLGSAETLAVHLHSSRANSGTAKVLVKIYHSNDNKNWVVYATLTGGVLSATAPTDEILSETPMSTSAGARGAFVRLGIVMQTTGDSADVIATGCGRTR